MNRSDRPIACTLNAGQMGDRLDEFRALFAASLRGKETTADGIRLRFAATAGVEAEVRDLARREQECCPFFTFTITADGEGVWWDATVADPQARPLLDQLFGWPDRLASPHC